METFFRSYFSRCHFFFCEVFFPFLPVFCLSLTIGYFNFVLFPIDRRYLSSRSLIDRRYFSSRSLIGWRYFSSRSSLVGVISLLAPSLVAAGAQPVCAAYPGDLSAEWRSLHQVWPGTGQHEPCPAQGIPRHAQGPPESGTFLILSNKITEIFGV